MRTLHSQKAGIRLYTYAVSRHRTSESWKKGHHTLWYKWQQLEWHMKWRTGIQTEQGKLTYGNVWLETCSHWYMQHDVTEHTFTQMW